MKNDRHSVMVFDGCMMDSIGQFLVHFDSSQCSRFELMRILRLT